VKKKAMKKLDFQINSSDRKRIDLTKYLETKFQKSFAFHFESYPQEGVKKLFNN
jgi:hypothetical protein